jgi:dihydroorotase
VNITWLVSATVIDLTTLIERMSCAPARVFKLAGGTLRQGAAADVTVFDPDARWTVDPAAFRSKGRNTPYAGRELKGRVAATVVGGRIVYRADR